jgi:hypothetical protein
MKTQFVLISIFLTAIAFGQSTKRIRTEGHPIIEKYSEFQGGGAEPVDGDDYQREEILKVEPKQTYYLVSYVYYSEAQGQPEEPHFSADSIPYTFKDAYIIRTRFWWSFSIFTVPIKIRPAIQNIRQVAKADVKNAGLFIGVYNKTRKKYFKDGTTSDFKLSYGGILAPNVETFNAANTNSYYVTGSEKTQMTLSAGISVAGTYKSLTFSIIPLATDFGLTKQSDHWVYNRKIWYGFGIGLDSKLLGF